MLTAISLHARSGRTSTSRSARWLQALFLLVALSGCVTINAIDHLREAQDAFSQAAAQENSARVAGEEGSGETLAALASARSGYASTLHSLDQIDDDAQTALTEQKLWGSAVTLRSLAQWRLGQHDAALKSLDDADKLKEQLFPRDAALLTALPALVATDSAYATITAAFGGSEAERAFALNGGTNAEGLTVTGAKERLVGTDGKGGAVGQLAVARGQVDDKHPLQLYLIQAQLAAYRNYKVAVQDLQQEDVPFDDPARREAQHNLFELKQCLQEGSSLPAHWEFLCDIDALERPN